MSHTPDTSSWVSARERLPPLLPGGLEPRVLCVNRDGGMALLLLQYGLPPEVAARVGEAQRLSEPCSPQDRAVLADPTRWVPIRWIAPAMRREDMLAGMYVPLEDVRWWLPVPPVPGRTRARRKYI